jgi:hypothetical protein
MPLRIAKPWFIAEYLLAFTTRDVLTEAIMKPP